MPYGYALLCGTIFLVFQKTANRLVKDGLLQGKRPSFTDQKASFWKAVYIRLIVRQIQTA